jgi:hypothetical protein
MDTSEKPQGTIRYVLFVVSHPVSPTPAQTFEFLNKILPELNKQKDGTAKIGTLWETDPIGSINMTEKAVEAFGDAVANNQIYTYRTLHLGLRGGDAKCLVIYDRVPTNPTTATRDTAPSTEARKWWRFWS